MKRVAFVLLMLSAAWTLQAAPVDGKWSVEAQAPAGRRGRGGRSGNIKMTLDLKSDGNKLTGSLTTSMGERSRSVEVQDGKIDGNSLSFTTVQRGQQGEVKVLWEGTVE